MTSVLHHHHALDCYASEWVYPSGYEWGVVEPAIIYHSHSETADDIEPEWDDFGEHQHGDYYYLALGPRCECEGAQ